MRLPDLQLSLLNVDALLNLTLQYLEKELTVCIPRILPEAKEQVVSSLQDMQGACDTY